MLSEDVRAELAGIDPKRRCDQLAEVSALFHTAGSLHLRGHGDVSLHLDLISSGVARRAFSLLRALGVDSEIRTYRRHAFGKETRYQLHIAGTEEALVAFREGGVISAGRSPLERPPRRLVGKRCCRAAYLRGALLGAGSLSGLRSPHLEVRCATLESAEFLAWAVGLEQVQLRVRERPRFAVAYAKGAERIADALALAGAADIALAIEEHAVVGSARSRANRLANADHANLVRASTAAHAQLEAIRELERADSLRRLPVRLREIADLRRRHPSLSLSELAVKCRPPTTKASAHRRLSKLIELAGR
ncbi:MAG: DNA-binding protein WhiA [Candidatus Rokuibacteriota bacterium]|nr:MAG: DNA-binding protein WhiA [Candidatus Rokubacteria bacterium]